MLRTNTNVSKKVSNTIKQKLIIVFCNLQDFNIR